MVHPIPNPPINLSFSELSFESVIISFAPPPSGPVPTSYLIGFQPTGDINFDTVTTELFQCKIINLIPSRNYTFQISSLYDEYISSPSAQFSITTLGQGGGSGGGGGNASFSDLNVSNSITTRYLTATTGTFNETLILDGESVATNEDLSASISSALSTLPGTYATITSVTNRLADYVTSTYLVTKLTEYVTTSTMGTQLNNYVLIPTFNTTMAAYVTMTGLTSILTSYLSTTAFNTAMTAYSTTTQMTSAISAAIAGLASTGQNISTTGSLGGRTLTVTNTATLPSATTIGGTNILLQGQAINTGSNSITSTGAINAGTVTTSGTVSINQGSFVPVTAGVSNVTGMAITGNNPLIFQNSSGNTALITKLKAATPGTTSFDVMLPDSGGVSNVNLQYQGFPINSGTNPVSGGAATFASGTIGGSNIVTQSVLTSALTPYSLTTATNTAITNATTPISNNLSTLQGTVTSQGTSISTLNTQMGGSSVSSQIQTVLSNTAQNLSINNLTTNGNTVIGPIGTGTYGSSALQVTGLQTSNMEVAQMRIKHQSNPQQELRIGYNGETDRGSIQAFKQGVGTRPLILQPMGGDTMMGSNALVGGDLNVSGITTLASVSAASGSFTALNSGGITSNGAINSGTNSISGGPGNFSSLTSNGNLTVNAPVQLSTTSGTGNNVAITAFHPTMGPSGCNTISIGQSSVNVYNYAKLQFQYVGGLNQPTNRLYLGMHTTTPYTSAGTLGLFIEGNGKVYTGNVVLDDSSGNMTVPGTLKVSNSNVITQANLNSSVSAGVNTQIQAALSSTSQNLNIGGLTAQSGSIGGSNIVTQSILTSTLAPYPIMTQMNTAISNAMASVGAGFNTQIQVALSNTSQNLNIGALSAQSGSIGGSNIVTQSLLTSSLSPYPITTQMNTAISNAMASVSTGFNTQIQVALSNTSQNLNIGALSAQSGQVGGSNIVTQSLLTSSLSPYPLTTQMNTAISNTTTPLSSSISTLNTQMGGSSVSSQIQTALSNTAQNVSANNLNLTSNLNLSSTGGIFTSQGRTNTGGMAIDGQWGNMRFVGGNQENVWSFSSQVLGKQLLTLTNLSADGSIGGKMTSIYNTLDDGIGNSVTKLNGSFGSITSTGPITAGTSVKVGKTTLTNVAGADIGVNLPSTAGTVALTSQIASTGNGSGWYTMSQVGSSSTGLFSNIVANGRSTLTNPPTIPGGAAMTFSTSGTYMVNLTYHVGQQGTMSNGAIPFTVLQKTGTTNYSITGNSNPSITFTGTYTLLATTTGSFDLQFNGGAAAGAQMVGVCEVRQF
jgi:hypothetical protein